MVAKNEESKERDARSPIEERVRKVRHLDPFHMSVRGDGRFMCQLEKPPHELEPDQARQVLEALEPVLRALRRRAADG